MTLIDLYNCIRFAIDLYFYHIDLLLYVGDKTFHDVNFIKAYLI